MRTFLFRGGHWLSSRGKNPGEVADWKKKFTQDLLDHGLQSHFSWMLESAPDVGLKVIRQLQGRPDDRSDGPRPGKKLLGDYRQMVPPERLELMHSRAEAAVRSRERLNGERARILESEAEKVLFAAVEGRDLAPVKELEEQLTALGRAEPSQRIGRLAENCSKN